MRGKRIQFDSETWHALNLLARDSMMSFQELADEAFRDLLRKHGRPVDLKDALKKSLKESVTTPLRRRREGTLPASTGLKRLWVDRAQRCRPHQNSSRRRPKPCILSVIPFCRSACQ